MAQLKALEGTRKELEAFLKHQPEQRRFRLVPLPLAANNLQSEEVQNASNQPPANEQGLAVMRLLSERHKGRRITDNYHTKDLLEEARAGAAYGYAPPE